ncbi:MAG: hypothetical protein SPI25_01435 [Dialister sp.]|nr:hypothetical protein [Dialister sp.]
MSEQEARDYRGVTLNESGEEESGRDEGTIRVRVVHFDSLPWWKKAAGILGFIVFIAICIAIAWFFFLGGAVLFAAGAIVYILNKYIFD